MIKESIKTLLIWTCDICFSDGMHLTTVTLENQNCGHQTPPKHDTQLIVVLEMRTYLAGKLWKSHFFRGQM